MQTADWSSEVDFIVVGAGTAGCALAARLSEDGANQVALIEAGGSDAHPFIRMPVGFMKALLNPRFTWGYMSEPEPAMNGRVLPVPRGRVMGGSSSINGMFHIRGHRLDFDHWATQGCVGWSYQEVLPYFIRSETHRLGQGPYHGGEGPLQVRGIEGRHLLDAPLREAALRAGYRDNLDYDGEHHDGSHAVMWPSTRAGAGTAAPAPTWHPTHAEPICRCLARPSRSA